MMVIRNGQVVSYDCPIHKSDFNNSGFCDWCSTSNQKLQYKLLDVEEGGET